MNIYLIQILVFGLLACVLPIFTTENIVENKDIQSLKEKGPERSSDGSSELDLNEEKRYRLGGKRSSDQLDDNESSSLENDSDESNLEKRYRLIGKRYRLYGKKAMYKAERFVPEKRYRLMGKRYRLMGKRDLSEENSDDDSNEENSNELEKRYRLAGKRYRLMGKRYRLMGKRYRLMKSA